MKKKVYFISFDEVYVEIIEYKFAELLGDNIEIEFITSNQYLKEHLENHTLYEILLIEESILKSLSVKPNCKKLVVLYENNIDLKEDNRDGIVSIYKYASVRTIVEKMNIQKLDESISELKNHTKIISIYSVIGGCGKTLSSLGIAYNLAKEGNKVLYVSTESQQDFMYYLESNSLLSKEFEYQCAINIENAKKMFMKELDNYDEVDYLKPFSQLPLSYQINTDKYIQLISYIKERNIYDYIIVELSKEIEKDKIAFLQSSDKVFLITEQYETAVKKLEKFLQGISALVTSPIVICNRFHSERKNYLAGSFILDNCNIGEYVEEFQNPLTLQEIKENFLLMKSIKLLE